jgi:hypothetical protein
MPGVLHDQPNVLLLCKLNACNYIPCTRDINRIARVIAQMTRAIRRGKRVAGAILVVRVHDL